MSQLAILLEGPEYTPAPPAPAADTSAFSGPTAPQEPTPGDFLDQIAEQIFDHLASAHPVVGVEDIDALVDDFLAELRDRLVTH